MFQHWEHLDLFSATIVSNNETCGHIVAHVATCLHVLAHNVLFAHGIVLRAPNDLVPTSEKTYSIAVTGLLWLRKVLLFIMEVK